eukprot:1556810-Prymnesium_polylepis.1
MPRGRRSAGTPSQPPLGSARPPAGRRGGRSAPSSRRVVPRRATGGWRPRALPAAGRPWPPRPRTGCRARRCGPAASRR